MRKFLGKMLGTVLLCGILFGVFSVVTVPFEMFKMSRARHWPSRKGTVTLSYAREVRSTRAAPWWRVEICGTYLDDGKRFCIRRVRYGDFRLGSGKDGSLETVAKYPVGRVIDVYYSPDNPKETILEADASWKAMNIMLGLGIAFLLLPVVLWLFRKQIEGSKSTNQRS